MCIRQVFVGVLLLFVIISSGLAAVKDSKDFPYKYDAYILPDSSGLTYSGTSPSSNYNATDGDILTSNTNTPTGYQSSYWYTTWDASTTTGYTVEIKLKVVSSTDTGTDLNRGWWLSVGESGSGAILSFFNGSVAHRGSSVTTIYSADNTNAFHTYRIVVNAGGTTFDLYCDGKRVVTGRAVAIVWEELGFGDPTASTAAPDTNVQVDYIRWDTNGAYAPAMDVNTLNYDSTNESLKVDSKVVFGPHVCAIGGAATPWTTTKSGSGDHYSILRTNADSLAWNTSVDRLNANVWQFSHTITNNNSVAKTINNLSFSFNGGNCTYSRSTKINADAWTGNIATETLQIGHEQGYLILHDVNDSQNAEVHFYLPDWIDRMGTLSTKTGGNLFSGTIYFDVSDDINNTSVRNGTDPYNSGAWTQVAISLAAGASKMISYRVGYFGATQAMLRDDETPIDTLGYYLYRLDRSQMLAMGYPLPAEAKDSTDFTNKYECNVLPDQAGFTYSGTTPNGIYNTISSNILTTDTDTPASYQTSYWKRAWAASVNTGYTLEAKLKVIFSSDNGSDINRGYWLVAGVNSNGVLLSVFANCVKLRTGSSLNTIYTADNTDDFHVYRVVVNPGGDSFDLYCDGILVVDDYVTVDTLSENILIGDPTSSSSSLDVKVQVDYVRWDTRGAFIPVPDVTFVDSVHFANKYECGVLPDSAGFTYGGTLPSTSYSAVSGGVFASDTSTPGNYQTSYWKKSWIANRSTGYSLEAKIKVISSSDSGTSIDRGYWLVAGEGNAGAIISLFDGSIKHRGSSTLDTIYTGSSTDGFHVYRIVVNPGATTFDFYRDGILIVDNRVVAGTLNEEIFFGDPTSSTSCPDTSVQIDYVRWTPSGAYGSERIQRKDSQDFPNQYEANALPDADGFTYSGTTPLASYNLVSQGVLTLNTSTPTGDQISSWSKTWSAATATGCTLEARLKVINSPDTGTDINRGFWMIGGIQNAGAVLSLFNNSIKLRAGTLDTIAECDNTDAFHTYRLMILPQAKAFKIYRDGLFIACRQISDSAGCNVYFGDPTGSTTCPDINVQIDYVRFDPTGAYEPIVSERRHSLGFANKYESDVLPDVAGFTYGGTTPSSTYNMLDGNNGYFTHDTLTASGYQSSSWSKTWDANASTGYSIEARLKVISSSSSGSDLDRGYWIAAGANGSGAVLSFFDNTVMHRGNSSLDTIITATNTDDFHTYRIVVAPGGSTFDLYRDGVLVVNNRPCASSQGKNVFFGDPTTSSNAPDAKVQIDYVRYDQAGTYFPAGTLAKQYPGHIVIVNWSDLASNDILPRMAEAGVGVVVLRNSDFLDISHGVSHNGSYSSAPSDINSVLDQIRCLGMKPVWWFSIRGALYNDPARNGGNPDTLIADHPTWFLPNALYWNNMYKYTDVFAAGWQQWCFNKHINDIGQYKQIMGFAFDEPYFYGKVVTLNGGGKKTFARNGINFLADIFDNLKIKGNDKIIIANFWVPADYAFDFFDYTVQEGPGLSYVTPLTQGKSCGARGIQGSPAFYNWDFTLTHFKELYVNDPTGIGWENQGWHYTASKMIPAINDLLQFLGHANLLNGVKLGNNVVHLELELAGERYLFLINGSTLQQNIATRLKYALPTGCSVGDVTIDTSTSTTKTTVSLPSGLNFQAASVPADSIYRVHWR